ncbi:hypothetical protein K488DRAFT_58019, partial [Vararia minispora EC-137]
TEHRNPEGRTYWFNTGTRESVWEKPDDLKTPFEKALNQTRWKEYFSGGRKYYYNTETKESKWDMPDELLLLLEKVGKDGAPTPAAAPLATPNAITGPTFNPGLNALAPVEASPPSNNGTPVVSNHAPGLPLSSSSVLPARPNLPDEPAIPHNGFSTLEEGEKAFTFLLRKAGVDASWTWDQTMRAIITDPLYKALGTLAEKKACWQKYTEGLRAKEQEEREARLAKTRPALRNMLKGNPNVFHYTTFATADKLFAQHPIWQQARVESERRLIFEEYVAELKQREVQEARAARTRAVGKLVALFKNLNVDVLTRWRQAHQLVLDSDEYRGDKELQNLPTLDILLAFEDYSRVMEREFEEQMRRKQIEKTRKERKAREAFKARSSSSHVSLLSLTDTQELIQELIQSGKIKARTKWKDVYPSFSTDQRYLDLLGKPGSNPIELFWDIVDGLDQKLDAKIAVVENTLRRYLPSADDKEKDSSRMDIDNALGFVVRAETEGSEFMQVFKDNADEEGKELTDHDLKEVFHAVRDQALRTQAEERKKLERKQRHMQDDLRYAMKKLSEPLDVNISYEDAVPYIEHLPEFKALDDEGRRVAFTKFIKRQKERLRELSEDGGSTTSRKRKEPSHRDHDRDGRDREGDRDRDVDKDRERDRDRDRGHDRGRGDRGNGRFRDDYRGRDYPAARERDWDAPPKDRYGSYGGRGSRRDDRDRDRRRRDDGAYDERGRDRERDRDRMSDRSTSVYRDESKRELTHDERLDERAEKVR